MPCVGSDPGLGSADAGSASPRTTRDRRPRSRPTPGVAIAAVTVLAGGGNNGGYNQSGGGGKTGVGPVNPPSANGSNHNTCNGAWWC